jgi:hypothetical protein
MTTTTTTRYAIVRGGLNVTLRLVRNYLPSNYTADETPDGVIVISGVDYCGWTLDGYVLPRLGSGLIAAFESVPEALFGTEGCRCTTCNGPATVVLDTKDGFASLYGCDDHPPTI